MSKRGSHTVETSEGPAVIRLAPADRPRALAVLGHGAGGTTHTPVLLGVRDALVAAGVSVALVDQPYRVAGRRFPDPAPRLDAAMADLAGWCARETGPVPIVLGGKSSGARVGCRVARAVGAAGVVALGFPLVPPGRTHLTRAPELDAGCPVLVVQGERDAFGTPDAVRTASGALPVTVHAVAGADHSFVARRADGRTTADCVAEAADAVVRWVAGLATPPPG